MGDFKMFLNLFLRQKHGTRVSFFQVSARFQLVDLQSFPEAPEKILELHFLAESMRELASKPGSE